MENSVTRYQHTVILKVAKPVSTATIEDLENQIVDLHSSKSELIVDLTHCEFQDDGNAAFQEMFKRHQDEKKKYLLICPGEPFSDAEDLEEALAKCSSSDAKEILKIRQLNEEKKELLVEKNSLNRELIQLIKQGLGLSELPFEKSDDDELDLDEQVSIYIGKVERRSLKLKAILETCESEIQFLSDIIARAKADSSEEAKEDEALLKETKEKVLAFLQSQGFTGVS